MCICEAFVDSLVVERVPVGAQHHWLCVARDTRSCTRAPGRMISCGVYGAHFVQLARLAAEKEAILATAEQSAAR